MAVSGVQGHGRLDKHVAAFAQDLQFNLDDRKLVLEDLWINILPEGPIIRPTSIRIPRISGTTVAMPEGASALRLEDPRHSRMMAAPPRLKDARREMRLHLPETRVGDVMLWESWLRHGRDEPKRV
ncbi:TIGR02466 family protein [Salipiger sp.]|uniref:TIGR02466 family protein n=1 Tax=Salipiger sp. TaxID=2078585 RepID=UPI003A983228